MTHELSLEAARLDRALSRIISQAPPASEAPIRIHAREVDSGGAPELSVGFLHWLGPICSCGRGPQCAPGCQAQRPDEHLADCEPACDGGIRFRATTYRNHPNRMKRALRQVRRLNPKAYDLLNLIVVHHYSFEAAGERLNAGYAARGQPERTRAEFAVLWVSGASMLATGF